MSILDTVTGMLGGEGEGGGAAHTILEMIQNHPGGAAGVVESFHNGGMGEVVSSWLGSGENAPVSADQIKSVFSNEQVAAVANKFGVSPDQASETIASLLPAVMDKLSPNGEVQSGDLMSQAGSLLKGILAKGA